MIRTYYLLTKPGIILGNLITTTAAFLLASKGHFDLRLFLALAAGLFGVIASACVFNNYIDRNIDGKMARTRNRALVRGLISGKQALFFASILGFFGLLILALYTHPLAALTASLGFIIYVALYSFWKYSTPYATLVGSISGAIPPVVGYAAASHTLDLGALLLFALLVLWQMPHFYAIAIYRGHEYASASIPVLPLTSGLHRTKIEMLAYVLAFLATLPLLTLFGYTGIPYLILSPLLGLSWLWLSLEGFRAKNDIAWARQMFRFSLVIITALSALISVG